MKLYNTEFVTIEIPAEATLSRINIKLNSNLVKGVNILGIESFNKHVFPVAPDGGPTADDNLFNQAILVLNVDGKETVQVPLMILKRSRAEAIAGDVSVNGLTELTGQKIDWEKCYIKFGSPVDTSTITASTKFVLLVHYAPLK